MKSTHKVQRFDYSKIDSLNTRRELWEYYGFHSKSGRLHIDTKRFKKIMVEDGTEEFLYEGMFKNRTTPYLIPKHVHKYDYKINMLRDLLAKLIKDWQEEYKPILFKIKSPKEVYENTKYNNLMFTANSEDYEEIEVESMLSAARRDKQYKCVKQSFYCQFICKICAEVDRYLLILMRELGYEKPDFSLRTFRELTDTIKHKENANLINDIKGYSEFDLLHKINNFLKHNTKNSYDQIRKKYPNYVLKVSNDITKKEYQSGMFAGDWVVLENDYIDNVLMKLVEFFEDYCKTILDEDIEEAKWNYDDYFKNVYKEVKNISWYKEKKYGI